MAVLTDADFQQIKKLARRTDAYDTLKPLGLSKQVWKDTFQSSEDWFVNGFNATPLTSFKAALEAESGALSVAQAKAIGKLWFQWRIGQTW